MFAALVHLLVRLIAPLFPGAVLPKFFDPDTDWRGPDKLEHAAGVGIFVALLQLIFPLGTAFVVAIIGAALFELGQWDVLRTAAPQKLGTPGYGFGLLDLAFGIGGATVMLVLFLLL